MPTLLTPSDSSKFFVFVFFVLITKKIKECYSSEPALFKVSDIISNMKNIMRFGPNFDSWTGCIKSPGRSKDANPEDHKRYHCFLEPLTLLPTASGLSHLEETESFPKGKGEENEEELKRQIGHGESLLNGDVCRLS